MVCCGSVWLLLAAVTTVTAPAMGAGVSPWGLPGTVQVAAAESQGGVAVVAEQAGPPGDEVVRHEIPRGLRWLCAIFEAILNAIHGVVGNWGASILVLALALRVFLFPLSRRTAKQQVDTKEKLAALKPEIERINAEFSKDGVRRNEELMKLYKAHGLNPLAQLQAALPLFIQLPILIALYQLLMSMEQIRGAGFLWIDDLTLPDRLFALGFSLPWLGAYFNLLPFIMFAAQVVGARRIETAAKPKAEGEKVRWSFSIFGMPLAMLLIFYPFPAGPMLYWTFANVSQAVEQGFTKRR